MSKLKKCTKCKNKKLKENFTKDASRSDGLSIYCKNCESKIRSLRKQLPKKQVKEKKCSICKKAKHYTEFHKNNMTSDGLAPCCKVCKNKTYYVPKEKIERFDLKKKKQTKICTKCNKEKSFEDYHNNKNLPFGIEFQCKKCKKEYRDLNREKLLERNRRYRKNNIERHRANGRRYSRKNKDKLKKYRKENIVKIRKNKREYNKKREKVDDLFKIQNRMKSLIKLTLKNNNLKKSNKTEEILGCAMEEFKEHIESQFLDWMSWDNYGRYNGELGYGWDLDHIIPISYAKTEEELYRLNHWSNFQPLCSKVNRYIKRNKLYPCTNLELNKTFENN